MSRTKFVMILLVACAASFMLARLGGRLWYERVSAQAIKGQAYTIEVEESRYGADANVAYREIQTVARKSDGSYVKQFHRRLSDGTELSTRRVFLVAGGKQVIVDPVLQTLTTYPSSSSVIAKYARDSTACQSISGGESRTILGFAAVKVTRSFNENGTQTTFEQWQAPGLSCAILEESIIRTSDGKTALIQKRVAKKIVDGDPDAELFEIPNYKEVSPSEYLKEYSTRFNIKPSAQQFGFFDEVYEKANGK